MKRLLALASLLLATSVFAQNTVEGTLSGEAHADNAGNAQTITFTSPGDTRATVKSAPSVGAPQIVSSNDTCMGSISGGVSVVGVGVSGGTTYESGSCVMLKESRELWNMGLRLAAVARMCMTPSMKEAIELSGTECPQTIAARKKTEVAK